MPSEAPPQRLKPFDIIPQSCILHLTIQQLLTPPLPAQTDWDNDNSGQESNIRSGQKQDIKQLMYATV